MYLTVTDIMTSHIITTRGDQTIINAARAMANHGISCLIVFSQEGIKGIITERDIITRVVCTGLDPETVMVRDIMSEPVIVITPDTSLEKAVELMLLKRIKKLPVIETTEKNMELVGIVSLIDVAKIQPDLISTLKELVQEEMGALEADFYIS